MLTMMSRAFFCWMTREIAGVQGVVLSNRFFLAFLASK